MPSQRQYDAKHLSNQEKYVLRVKKAYLNAIKEVSKVSSKLTLNSDGEFYFRNNPEANKAVNKLIDALYRDVYAATTTGINQEWNLATDKLNEITDAVFGAKIDYLPTQYKTQYYAVNDEARREFLKRTENGLTLSDRVWRNSKQFKTELELSLEATLESGIGSGQSADKLSQRVRQYLNEPDKLFRRVRDKNGVLRLSKAAQSYHPGQGVYRSSYKNAQRLTRNETNFSYEASQQEKRKQQDFIVGIEIRTSGGHDPADDRSGISCASLAGKYPKTFDWTYKWHVNCKCYSLNIIKSQEELDKDIDNILDGGAPNTKSKNEVKSNPNNFNSYVVDNKDRWKNWKNQPRSLTLNKN